MINDILNLPWDKIAAMMGAFIGMITLITMVGTRWGPFRRWAGAMLQDMLGITALRNVLTERATHQADGDTRRDQAIENLAGMVTATGAQVRELTTTVRGHVRNNTRHLLTPKRGTGPGSR